MNKEQSPRTKKFTKWVRVNAIFLSAAFILVVAAILSVNYAFKRGQTPAAGMDTVGSLQSLIPAPAEEADTIEDGVGAQGDSGETKNESGSGSGSGESPPATRPGVALGESIDCVALDSEESKKLKAQISRLSILDISTLRKETIALHKEYEHVLKSKGCDPRTMVESVLKEVAADLGNFLR